MVSYAIFLTGSSPEQGRDTHGRWMRMKRVDEVNTQSNLL